MASCQAQASRAFGERGRVSRALPASGVARARCLSLGADATPLAICSNVSISTGQGSQRCQYSSCGSPSASRQSRMAGPFQPRGNSNSDAPVAADRGQTPTRLLLAGSRLT